VSSAVPAPGGSVRTWIDGWIQSRLPRSEHSTLSQRNIYIVPTRGGLVFALLLLLMLLASINYQLNLGYVLTFLLAGSALVSMHLTHGNLRGLTLRLRTGATAHAGEPALFELLLSNPGAARYGLAVRLHDRARHGKSFVIVDVPAQGQGQATVSIVPATRGWHAIPALVVETGFPFGLFRAWTLWRPAAQVLAWPRPERPAPPLPLSRALAGEPGHPQREAGAEMDGVRAWRRGDGLRQVVWKKVARTGELVSRETTGSSSRELSFDWLDTGVADPEQRLSRLAAWIDAAELAGIDYSVRLPGHTLPPGQGPLQRRAALDRLALW
jgi:uncharacterized protein (DUF58 family)